MFIAKQKPYYDDYDENAKFLSMLFRPGLPVQSRELTQLQSMLQMQIERMGNHYFKAGACILDGELSFDTEINYVKVSTTMRDPKQLVGRTLTGLTSHVKGSIVHVELAEGDDPVTLYVRFVTSDGQTGIYGTWSVGEQFQEIANINIFDNDDAVGVASIAQIERGVYYVNGYFALVDAQTIVLNKYDNVPSYRIGLQVFESIVTPEEDQKLLDNAIGSYNYAAPGAHRYKLELKLAKVDLAKKVDNDQFIELGQIQAGRIIKTQTKTEYNELEKTLARRTYDESGDYTVRPFKACVREHRSNDRGQWKANSHYLVGDIVRNHGKCYIAKSEGTSSIGDGPNWDTGRNSDGNVWWEFTKQPNFNNGVYPAEGKVVNVEIIDGGNGYIEPPRVEIVSSSGKGATATAVVSGGKVVRVIVDSYGSGYLHGDASIKFAGGHGRTDGCICPDSENNPVPATAIVHTDSGNPNMLAVGLESGKAYVRGFEIEKVGTSWINIDKARSTARKNSVLLTPSVGSYIRVSNIKGVPPFVKSSTDTKAGKLYIYDCMHADISSAKPIGTCMCRGLEWDNGQEHNPQGVYRLYVHEIELEPGYNFTSSVKSFKAVLGNFHCDISPILTPITGSISVQSNKITGSGTSFRTEVVDGDYLMADNKYFKCTTVDGQNLISTSSNQTCTNMRAYLCTTTMINPQGNNSVYRYPDTWVKSLINKENDDNFDIDYVTMELIQGTSDENDGNYTTATFTASGGNVSFASTEDRDNYILFADGEIKPFIAQQSASAGRSLTVKIKEPKKSENVQLLATLRKTGGATGLRKKTSRSKKVYITKAEDLKKSDISLGVCDVYRIVSVKMYPFSKLESGSIDEKGSSVDITDRFDLIDGQTESYYGISCLRLKNGYSAPTSPIIIDCYYFEHSRDGDYFTVDSYDVPYDEIPSYNGWSLRDAIDFRTSGNNNRVYMIKSGTEIEVGYRYYLARRDRLCLDYQGNFINVKGIPSSNPQQPAVPNLAMVIHDIDLMPYTIDASTNSIDITMVDNRRYTMRDIGKLEARIDRLEEYTALSLLEQQTESMNIQDNTGLDRFKQGFIVDNFQSGSIASITDKDLSCSIDNENGVCRPPFTQSNYTMTEYLPTGSTADAYRASNNYMMYGKVFTLPLDPANPHVPIVEQPLATRIQNINPFAIAAFVGSLTVNPSSDDWFDVEYAPDVVTQVEGDYLEKKNSLEGTKWNSWQNQWYGQPVTTTTSRLDHTTGRAGRNLYEHWKDTTVTSQKVGQTREGIKTTVTSKIDYEVVGDRIVSTSSIPYMRSRWLLVKARNLKPYTRYYPFFDNVQVDYWCVPASRVEFETGTVTGDGFDGTTAAGSDANSDARKIITTKYSFWPEQTDRTCLDIGDVITATGTGDGNTQKMTAVCVGYGHGPSEQANASNRVVDYMYVVNIKNVNGTAVQGNSTNDRGEETFDGMSLTGCTVHGSISGANGKVAWSQGNRNHSVAPLITNAAGELYFMFWIPDGDKVEYATSENKSPVFQFRCGDRVLSLSEDGEKNDYDAEVVYSATGTYNKRERSVNAVRNAVVSTQYISEDRTITSTISSTTKDRAVYRDPLAQTFLIGTPGGCFLSKVDIFFASVPGEDNPLPVTLQIRTVENGIPTSKVLPFSEVTLRPDQIKLSSETVEYVDANGKVVKAAKYDTPTTFEFESPVYCEDTSEYAVVLLSDSNDYNVWIAQVGEIVPGTTNLVSKQPYTGVLLKSQNASTWTPDQTQDLKMTVYRANFFVADNENNRKESVRIGNVQFAVNNPLPQWLKKNCFQTRQGSRLVRVYHPNHGLVAGCKAVISREDFDAVDKNTNLTGTISVSPDTRRVQGNDTRFLNEIKQYHVVDEKGGEKLVWPTIISGEKVVGQVERVVDNYTLYLANDPEFVLDGTEFTTTSSDDTIGGIDYNSLIGTHEIQPDYIDTDSYIINVDKPATSTGYYGDGKFKAEGVFNYTTLQPNFNTQTFGDTTFDMLIQAMPGSENGTNNQALTNAFGVVVNDNNIVNQPLAIWNKANLVGSSDVSLIANVKFSSTNPALSPIIDSDRMSILLINNIIDNPNEININNDELDVTNITDKNNFGFYGQVTKINIIERGRGYTEIPTVRLAYDDTGVSNLKGEKGGVEATAKAIVGSDGSITDIIITNRGAGYTKPPKITIDGGNGSGAKATAEITLDQIISIVDGSTAEKEEALKTFDNVKVGQYIEHIKDANRTPYMVTNKLVNDKAVIYQIKGDVKTLTAGQASVGEKINLRGRFTSEICPTGGSTHAKYITRPIGLSNTCNMAKIMFAACVPKMSDIEVYCKAYSASDSYQYSDVPWFKLEPSKGYHKVDIGTWKFTDVEYIFDDNVSFDIIAVKIVFKSLSTSSAPMIKDFRVIGCI